MDAALKVLLTNVEFSVSYCGFISEKEILESLHQGFKFPAFSISNNLWLAYREVITLHFSVDAALKVLLTNVEFSVSYCEVFFRLGNF